MSAIQCNNCHTSNFKEIFVIEKSYGIGPDPDSLAGHTHAPMDKHIPALACKHCGNIQLNMKE